MRVQLNIEYHTHWGQTLCVSGSLPELGASDAAKAVAMTYAGGDTWSLTLDLPAGAAFSYRYLVREAGQSDRIESGAEHRFAPAKAAEVVILDRWQDIPLEKPFFSSAFTDAIFHDAPHAAPLKPTAGKLIIRCFAPQLDAKSRLLICGTQPELGAWDAAKALPMYRLATGEWEAQIDQSASSLPMVMKFVELTADGHTAWEAGDNRIIQAVDAPADAAIIVGGFHFSSPTKPWRGSGVAIPVFSLRTDEGFGTGEFLDLIPLIDWAASTGQQVIQILPINDTTMSHTWQDSYPYNANSTFALHPLYLRVDEAGTLADPAAMKVFADLRAELNRLPEVDYERTTEGKWDYLRRLYAEQGRQTLASKEFKAFFKANKAWLVPYAAFSYLRDKYGTPDFHLWATHSQYDEAEIAKLTSSRSKVYAEVALHYFVQFHLDRQMTRVSAYARSRGVVLKGDIPIGISRTSVDAWMLPQLFHMDCQAGAPPDAFARDGQNWGFPTYNWEVMKQDGYYWWKRRFRKMADYFDAYRIDHILGFFRIWQIPVSATSGLLGYFNPALPYSADEIARFGLRFDEPFMTVPSIRRCRLHELFGAQADTAAERYLEPWRDDRLRLRPEVDSQRKIIDLLGRADDDTSRTLLAGLMRLATEVLFITAPGQPGHYHPRISAQDMMVYHELPSDQQQAFDRLYHHYFYERNNKFWCDLAMEKLPALIDSTRMLACAEDLGMIPDGVAQVLDRLRILSLEVQRMPKDVGVDFGNPYAYPYLAVCTTGTHDTSTLREWWTEDLRLSDRYYHDVLWQHGPTPAELTPPLAEAIVRNHLNSPAMFTILPLQDWLATDATLRRNDPTAERINIPAIPRHYWRYRMHLTVADLLAAHSFNAHIKMMIESAGR